MLGFKGFNKDLKCRDKQYVIGETAEEPTAELCETGIHFCEHPLDVFGYYSPGEGSRYCEVESPDETVSPKTASDTKRVTTKLTIKAELTIPAIVQAAVKFVFDRATWSDTDKATGNRGAASATGNRGAASATGNRGAASATGDQGAASATGNRGAASATGDQGAASATGNRGAASATGYQGAASATGYQGAASATGDQGAASATGDQGAASATGNRGAASATGDQGAASATGNRGAASATGDQGAALTTGYASQAKTTGTDMIACALGEKSSAAGDVGNWLVLAEKDDAGNILGIQTVKVDGEVIKANTFYTLSNDQIIEWVE